MNETGDVVTSRMPSDSKTKYIGKPYNGLLHRSNQYDVNASTGQITRVHGTRQRKRRVSTPGKLVTKGAPGRRSRS